MDDRSRGRRRARWTTRAMLAASVVGTAWLSVVSLTGQESNSSPKADATTPTTSDSPTPAPTTVSTGARPRVLAPRTIEPAPMVTPGSGRSQARSGGS
jgi:hypothetical protein